jgi:hypothetical protein
MIVKFLRLHERKGIWYVYRKGINHKLWQPRNHPEANPPPGSLGTRYRYREVKDRTRKYDMVKR